MVSPSARRSRRDLRVKSAAETRFCRRWWDYCDVLERGTDHRIGIRNPAPPDRRADVQTLLPRGDADATADAIAAADAILEEVWKLDPWQRRLSRFLNRLDRLDIALAKSFRALVVAGCQPDTLAFDFHQAASRKEASGHQKHLRDELDVLDKLAADARQALARYRNRRREFDQDLAGNRLQVLYEEPGGANLNVLCLDVDDEFARQEKDLLRLRQQIDGRREPLLGHARVRLSLRICQITGKYHDGAVAAILSGLSGVDEKRDALKQRRSRWARHLNGPDYAAIP